MVVLELDKVEIDYCIKCSGIWLDAGELELLLESSEEKNAVMNSFKVDKKTGEKKKKCPICSKKMGKIRCGKDGSVLIDKCRYNHGIWFDRGELYQVISLGTMDKDNRILAALSDMFIVKPN